MSVDELAHHRDDARSQLGRGPVAVREARIVCCVGQARVRPEPRDFRRHGEAAETRIEDEDACRRGHGLEAAGKDGAGAL